MVSDGLISKEELELMLVVVVPQDYRVEVNEAVRQLFGI